MNPANYETIVADSASDFMSEITSRAGFGKLFRGHALGDTYKLVPGLEDHASNAVALTKIELAGQHRLALEHELWRHGVSESTLYPGFGGVARDIRRGEVHDHETGTTLLSQLAHTYSISDSISTEAASAMQRLHDSSPESGDWTTITELVRELFDQQLLTSQTYDALTAEIAAQIAAS